MTTWPMPSRWSTRVDANVSGGDQPAVRASAARDSLAFLDKFHVGSREKVLALIPAASRAVIEETSRLSWVPIEHDHWIVDGIVTVLGRERAIRCWADSVSSQVEQPLLRTFVSGMLGIVGNDPARVIALIPKGWPMIWRDMCSPRFALDDSGRPVLHLDHIDPRVRVHDNYLYSWHGACLGFARLARYPVNVELDIAPDKGSATATFNFRHLSVAPPAG